MLRALILDVFLIDRLREVRAFRGFSRVVPEPDGALLSPNLKSGRLPPWLPANEVFGEGIFIRLDTSRIEQWETIQKHQLSQRLGQLSGNLAQSMFATSRFARASDHLPRWVMIHTLSHLLMRQLCFEAGYGASAIRERIYLAGDRAVMLIYTADADSEGSLAGASCVRQSRHLRIRYWQRLSAQLGAPMILFARRCHRTDQMVSNLSACHACSLAPETSCAHLNLLLDRALVIGDGLQAGSEVSFATLWPSKRSRMRLPNESQLSREQKEVCFAQTDRPMLVTGPPGSGKTVVAIFRQNALRKKKQRVQALVYNHVLCRYAEVESTFYGWLNKWWRSSTGAAFPASGYGAQRRSDFLPPMTRPAMREKRRLFKMVTGGTSFLTRLRF